MDNNQPEPLRDEPISQPTPPPSNEPAPIPYARFQGVVAEKNAAKAEIEKLTTAQKQAADDLKKANEKILQVQADFAAEQARAMRLQVAAQSGLPIAFADRLQGANEEELRTDAARMLEFIKPATPGVPPPAMGQPMPPPDISKMTPEQIRQQAANLWPVK